MRYSTLASAVLLAATAAPALALPITARAVDDALVEREYYDDLVARSILEARRHPPPRTPSPEPPSPPPAPPTPPSPPPAPPNSPSNHRHGHGRREYYDDLVVRSMLEARRHPPPRTPSPEPPSPPPAPPTPPSPPPAPPNSPSNHRHGHGRREFYDDLVARSILEARRHPPPRTPSPEPPSPPPAPPTPPSPPPAPPNSPSNHRHGHGRREYYDDLVVRSMLEARRHPPPRTPSPEPPSPPPAPPTPPSPPPAPPNSPSNHRHGHGRRELELEELFARGWEYDELD